MENTENNSKIADTKVTADSDAKKEEHKKEDPPKSEK